MGRPERVTFELVGLNEQLDGEGTFLMEPYEEASPIAAAPRKGLVARLVEAVVRFFLRRARGRPASDNLHKLEIS